jgi:hypothetical protein
VDGDQTTMAPAADLDDLTPCERLWLWRRSQPPVTRVSRGERGGAFGRGGWRMSAGEAAAALGVSVAAYCDAEARNAAAALNILARVDGDEPTATPAERLALARRRFGMTAEAVCRAFGGISRPTLYAWERECDPRLVQFWRGRGFEL